MAHWDAMAAIGRARWRAFDAALGGRLLAALAVTEAPLEAVLAADPELPCRPILGRWRREAPAFDAAVRQALAAQRRRRRARAASRPGPETTAVVTRAIRAGGTLASLGRTPGMPSRQTLRRWVRVDPAFAQAVARACEIRDLWLSEQMLAAAGDWRTRTRRELQARVAPISRQRARLGHRPGATHRRRAESPAQG
ncbi:MAG: hypothetical protein ACJ798_13535 [Phenylobacterium sp.]